MLPGRRSATGHYLAPRRAGRRPGHAQVRQHLDQNGNRERFDDSYDLVYSAGLFDCLKDRAVRAAGGSAGIGNFDVANPTRPLMELILDWPLYSSVGRRPRSHFSNLGTGMTVEREATGINLFAVIGA